MGEYDTHRSFRVDHGFKMAEILGNASGIDAGRFESNIAADQLMKEEEDEEVEDENEEKQEFTRSALMSGIAKELR
jgi:hypothetical protein